MIENQRTVGSNGEHLMLELSNGNGKKVGGFTSTMKILWLIQKICLDISIVTGIMLWNIIR